MSGPDREREGSELGEALGEALRARAGRPPRFPEMLRVARLHAAPGRDHGHAADRAAVRTWRLALPAAGTLALLAAVFLSWRGTGPAPDPVAIHAADATAATVADVQLARDLALARLVSPERQWHMPTDALIAAHGFHTPVIVELPGIDNPFKESVL